MEINWDAVMGVATSLTAVLVLGSPMILWFLNRPRVFLLPFKPKGEWHYIYEGGERIKGIDIIITISLENRGQSGTTIKFIFETKIHNCQATFCSSDVIELKGEGAQKVDTNIVLRYLSDDISLKEEDILHGKLKLIPWGKCRFPIFGKKYISVDLDVARYKGAI